jgi:hypothetical protein
VSDEIRDPDQQDKGSSSCKVAGNTYMGGVKEDVPVDKKCSRVQLMEGEVIHQTVSCWLYPVDMPI